MHNVQDRTAADDIFSRRSECWEWRGKKHIYRFICGACSSVQEVKLGQSRHLQTPDRPERIMRALGFVPE